MTPPRCTCGRFVAVENLWPDGHRCAFCGIVGASRPGPSPDAIDRYRKDHARGFVVP